MDGDGADHGRVETDGGDVPYGVEDHGKPVFLIQEITRPCLGITIVVVELGVEDIEGN